MPRCQVSRCPVSRCQSPQFWWSRDVRSRDFSRPQLSTVKAIAKTLKVFKATARTSKRLENSCTVRKLSTRLSEMSRFSLKRTRFENQNRNTESFRICRSTGSERKDSFGTARPTYDSAASIWPSLTAVHFASNAARRRWRRPSSYLELSRAFTDTCVKCTE